MSEPAAAPQRHWRNPVFLLVFVSGAGAWLAVLGWLTWRYFNPVNDWVGGQNFFAQEVLGTFFLLAWAGFLIGVALTAGAFLGIVPGLSAGPDRKSVV